MSFENAQQKFDHALDLFEKHVIALEAQAATSIRYIEASDTARRLYTTLKKKGSEYFSEPRNATERQLFMERCAGYIQDARPILEQHQNWRIILNNLFKSIANSVAFWITGSKDFFFSIPRTDAGLGLDILKHDIEKHDQEPAIAPTCSTA